MRVGIALACVAATACRQPAPSPAEPEPHPPASVASVEAAPAASANDENDPGAPREELPPLPDDPDFGTFWDETLAGCKLAGDWEGSNADMARRGGSERDCFIARATGALLALPVETRWEVLGGSLETGGDAWYDEWERFASITTELWVRIEYTSDSFHGGGTMLLSLRPSRSAAVAGRVAYWLTRLGNASAAGLAPTIRAHAQRGELVEPALAELKTHALAHVRQMPETTVPEAYPTHITPLYGGDWRRVARDVDRLARLVPRLGRRICRSSRELAVRLGGARECESATRRFLYAQVDASWASPTQHDHGVVPPGVDPAYFPFASATYAACEVDAHGEPVQFDKALPCLKHLLNDAVSENRPLHDAAKKYVDALCQVELAQGVELSSPIANALGSEDECRAVASPRAAFLVEAWTRNDAEGAAAHVEGVRAHVEARSAWGARVAERLPKLKARYLKALSSTDPKERARWHGSVTDADLQQSVAAVDDLPKRAKELASVLCTQAFPISASFGPACTPELTRYWLSYAYFPGMQWEGEDEP